MGMAILEACGQHPSRWGLMGEGSMADLASVLTS